MKNAAKVAALSLLVIVTLAGCFKGKVDLTLNSDNTIDGTMVVAIQAGIGESLGMSDDDLLGQMTGDVSGEFDGAKVEDYDEDGFIGKKYTFENQPLDSFKGDSDGSDISITRDGDKFIVDGTWSTDDGTDTEGMDPATMGASFTFSVTFPGGVTESNGTVSDDGNTVTWDLLDPPDTLHAEGKATTGGSPWAWLVIGLGVLIIAAVIVTVVVRSRAKKSKVETVPYTTAPDAVSAEGVAPATAAETPAAEAPAAPPAAEDPQAP